MRNRALLRRQPAAAPSPRPGRRSPRHGRPQRLSPTPPSPRTPYPRMVSAEIRIAVSPWISLNSCFSMVRPVGFTVSSQGSSDFSVFGRGIQCKDWGLFGGWFCRRDPMIATRARLPLPLTASSTPHGARTKKRRKPCLPTWTAPSRARCRRCS